MSHYLFMGDAMKVTVNGKRVYVSKYHSEKLAREASKPGSKQWLVLGDVADPYGRFWVCRPVDAARLQSAGFEIV